MPQQSSSSNRQNSASTSRKHDNDQNPDASLAGIGNYTFEKTIGQGNFAKVKLAKHKITGQEVAVKTIDKTTLDEKKLSKLHREVRIMKMLNHPHIVKLYEVIETKYTLFLVMEYASGGELYDYLVSHGRMKEKEARAKFRQILSAVSYCHKKRVIHRDLKAENLLLDSKLNIKIADFGFSNQFSPDGQLDTFCGSPPYAAPELFQGRKYTGPEVDVWSLGVILYVVCTGSLPFDGKDLKEMREVVCRGRYKVPFYLSDPCEKLLRKLLVREPIKRASLDMLIDDSWLNDGFPDSAIVRELPVDLARTPDEEVLRYIEEKYNVDREHTLTCLHEMNYDDVTALYLLAIDLKATGKWQSSASHASITPAATSTTASHSTNHRLRDTMNPIGEEGAAVLYQTNSQQQGINGSTLPQILIPKPTANSSVSRERSHTISAASPSSRPRPTTWAIMDAVGSLLKTVDATPTITTPFSDSRNIQDATATANPDRSSFSAAQGIPILNKPQVHQREAVNSIQDPSGSSTISPLILFYAGAAVIAPPLPVATSSTPLKKNVLRTIQTSIVRRMSDAASLNPHGSPQPSPTVKVAADTPTGGTDGKPRSLRFTFNSNATSLQPPDAILEEVQLACQKLNIKLVHISRFTVEGYWNFCESPLKFSASPIISPDPQIMEDDDSSINQKQTLDIKADRDLVRFEIEVCELPRLKNIHGLKFRRMSGPSQEYKEVCGRILSTVKL